MKKTFILCVLIFLALMGVLFYAEFGFSRQPAAAQNTRKAAATIPLEPKEITPPAETEIRAKLEEYYRIARTGDRAALTAYSEKITAPEYRYSSEMGKMGKQESFRLFSAALFDFGSADFDDFSVQIFGDTAIAKYRDFSQVRANGDFIKSPTRFTNVWVKRDGRWLIVAEHSSILSPPKLLPRHPLSDHWAGGLIDRRMALLF